MRHVSRLAIVFLSAVLLVGVVPRAEAVALSAEDVEPIISTAAKAIDATTAVIAVTDREGIPLGVFRKTGGNRGEADLAVNLARTGAFSWFDLFLRDSQNPCTQGSDPANRGNQSGIVFFPGAAPLYRNGQLIGGLGVSGDGVEQDDVVTEAGTAGFEAPPDIRADQILVNGVRLPYFKFNRNPTR